MVGISIKRYSYMIDKYKVSADVVGKTIEEIEERDGAVTSKSFLEASRPEDAPTHGIFEWDDSVAAEKYRLVQSSEVIRNLRIEVEEVPAEDVQLEIKVSDDPAEQKKPRTFATRAFVNTVEKNGPRAGQYKSFSTAMSDEDTRFVVIGNALREMRNVTSKYSFLKEFKPVNDVLDRIEEEQKARVGEK